MFSSSHLPRSTGDVRLGYDVTVSRLPWPSRPPRCAAGQRARDGSACPGHPESRSGAPAARSGTCSPPSAAPATLRSSRTWLSMKSSVSRWNASRRFSSKSGKRSGSGAASRMFLSRSHWPAKFSTSAFARGVGHHAPHLRRQHVRVLQPSARRLVQQFVVGDAAPEEERQPRRQLEIGEPIRRARLHARRIALGAEQEVGIDQDALERELDARLERCRPSDPSS